MEKLDRDELTERMADNLPVLRKKLRLSQDQLAAMIGSTRFTIMQIETKKRKMTWQMFMLLALVFEKNKDTSVLIRALDIYSDDLEQLIVKDFERER